MAVVAEGRAPGAAGDASAEVLYGLQQRTHHDVMTKHHDLRPFVDRVRQAQVCSLDELDPKSLSACDRRLHSTMTNYVYLARATPENERHKDIWNATVFGHSGTLLRRDQPAMVA